MKRIFYTIILLFAVFSVSSCDIDSDENFHFVTLRITDVELPESFIHNQVYNIQVTYERLNGCTYFEGFDVQKPYLTTREIVAIGTELDDAQCTHAVEEAVATFNFQVLYDETYTFRFFNGLDENNEPIYLEYEVEVQN
ncbi:hypothetical protein GCM10011414_05860 [Croceivirga lutea]|uniref:hypothetical protein n=1 Tax=Croceivirga lutea TaxID=1775167 RepID=UPI00163990DF|nr:hypothetical protein [Croceivirga lutea]GGG39340.1 hypothetical protein GCM10011414_05860 [Croceivirga lutea]